MQEMRFSPWNPAHLVLHLIPQAAFLRDFRVISGTTVIISAFAFQPCPPLFGTQYDLPLCCEVAVYSAQISSLALQ